jgi:hypothetical protein
MLRVWTIWQHCTKNVCVQKDVAGAPLLQLSEKRSFCNSTVQTGHAVDAVFSYWHYTANNISERTWLVLHCYSFLQAFSL